MPTETSRPPDSLHSPDWQPLTDHRAAFRLAATWHLLASRQPTDGPPVAFRQMAASRRLSGVSLELRQAWQAP